MQTPIGSPLGILLFIAALYLLIKSPQRLRTFVRMLIAFVLCALVLMILGALLRRGDPEALGRIAGLVALLVAVSVGWWHVRSMRPAAKPPSGETP